MSVTMPIEQKVAIAREFVARVFNEHQPDRASEYFVRILRNPPAQIESQTAIRDSKQPWSCTLPA